MERTCYGTRRMSNIDIQPTRIILLMCTLANLSLNNFIDNDCRVCIINEPINNLHEKIMGEFVENVKKHVSTLNDNDIELLNIDDLINDVINSKYEIITPELLFVNLGKILYEDNEIFKSNINNELLNFDTNTLLKAINLNLETYTEEEDLDNLNGDMWELATDIINKIKDIHE